MVLKPEAMSKITIAGPKRRMEAVIRELHRLKILHIVDHVKSDDIDIGSPLEKANELSEVLVNIRSIASWLNVKRGDGLGELKLESGYDLGAMSKKLYLEVRKRLEKIKEIENKVNANNNLIAELEALKNVAVDLNAFAEYKSIAYFAGYVKNSAVVEEKLRKITDKFDLYAAVGKGKNIIVLFVDALKKEEAKGILMQNEFIEISMANLRGMKGTSKGNIEKLEKENLNLLAQKEKISKSMDKLRAQHGKYLLFAEDFLEKEIEKAEAPLKFAETKSAFVVKGWIPAKDAENVIKKLNSAAKNRIFIGTEKAGEKDKVPVKLKNPNIAKPFEFLMDLYTTPTYREIDPTFFVFISFPLLFGFMLGDFGYGMVTLALFYFLKNKLPKLRPLLNILIFSSVATIFFGLLFGEFFGLEQIFGMELPHVLSRSHQIMLLLYVAIAIGIVHINWGLIIGFFNELNSHGVMHAIYAKGSWFILQIGLLLLIYCYSKSILNSLYFVIGLILLSVLVIFMLYKGEGIKGPIEIPTIFSNALSYARLMALGLASVKLAEVVNEFAAEFFHHGGFFILYGVLLLIVGHVINMALGILGPFLHSLRLHYVEFFTKFFKGGAERFRPFGLKV